MSPLIVYNNKLLINNNQLSAGSGCCCKCEICTGSGCCGSEWPTSSGICCENIWRIPSDTGVCCSGIWYAPPEDSGTCCGDVWYPIEESGVCCGNEWHPPEDSGNCCGDFWLVCPEGLIFLRWGEQEKCCGCVSETVIDPITGEMVNTIDRIGDLCCPVCDPYNILPDIYGCKKQCCRQVGDCLNTTLAECDGNFYEDYCCDAGCPAPCCREDSNGDIVCDMLRSVDCTGVSGITVTNCEECTGACCSDEDPSAYLGQKTQEECSALGGIFHGLGSTATDCGLTKCRDPFTENCCEHKQSSGSAGVIFNQPGNKRSPPFEDTGVCVTITGTTDSKISIRGQEFGVNSEPPQRCPVNTSFCMCGDSFEVEPVPCGTSIRNIDLTVCWTQGNVSQEFLYISECDNIDVPVGNCGPSNNSCNTIIQTSKENSNNSLKVSGKGPLIFENNSNQPFVFNGTIDFPGEGCGCDDGDFRIILRGSNKGNNTMAAYLQDAKKFGNPGCPTSVIKEGSGRWLLSNSTNDFTGGVQVKEGEFIIPTSTTSDFSGPIGAEPATKSSVIIGSSNNDNNAILFLLKSGVTLSHRVIEIMGSKEVIIGGVDPNGTATFSGSGSGRILLKRNIKLRSETNGTVIFNNIWSCDGGNYTITIGENNKDGTIRLNSVIPNNCISALNIDSGLVILSANNDFNCITTINGGTAKAESLTAFGTGDIVINPNGTLNKNGFAIENNIINNGGTVID